MEKKIQELPYFEKVQTYSKPAFTAMQVTFKDSTPPKDVPYLFYHACARSSPMRRDSYRLASSARSSTTNSATSIRSSTR